MTSTAIVSGREGLADAIRDRMAGAKEMGIAAACVTDRGLDLCRSEIRGTLARRGRVSVVHVADGAVTEPKVIQWFVQASDRNPKLHHRVYIALDDPGGPAFNPNIYWGRDADGLYSCVTGGVGLNQRAVPRRHEMSVATSGNKRDDMVVPCLDQFHRAFADSRLIVPDAEFLELYTELFECRRRCGDHSPFRRDTDNELRDLTVRLEGLRGVPEWVPATQSDAVLVAMQEDAEMRSIADIHERCIEVGVKFSIRGARDWPQHSIRRVLNTNTIGKKENAAFFERIQGEGSKSGRYRLTPRGRTYAGRG